MSKELDIVSWNVGWKKYGGINDPQVQDVILQSGADIAVFPEAASEERGVTDETVRNFLKNGYYIVGENYADDDGRKDRHTLALAYKPEVAIADPNRVRLAGRTALQLSLRGDVSFTGVHLDDRLEATRMLQASAIIENARTWDAILAGDFNAMHGADTWAKRLDSLSVLADALPSRNPGEVQNKLQRLGSLSQRLAGMATGDVLEYLETYQFEDADSLHKPTMFKGPIKVQLDRVMTRGAITVIEPTVVESAEGLSDHSRIRTKVAIG